MNRSDDVDDDEILVIGLGSDGDIGIWYLSANTQTGAQGSKGRPGNNGKRAQSGQEMKSWRDERMMNGKVVFCIRFNNHFLIVLLLFAHLSVCLFLCRLLQAECPMSFLTLRLSKSLIFHMALCSSADQTNEPFAFRLSPVNQK